MNENNCSFLGMDLHFLRKKTITLKTIRSGLGSHKEEAERVSGSSPHMVCTVPEGSSQPRIRTPSALPPTGLFISKPARLISNVLCPICQFGDVMRDQVNYKIAEV